MQELPIRARGLFRTGMVLVARGVAIEQVTLGHLCGCEEAMGAEQDDGVKGDEERAEDSSEDRLPSYASGSLEASDEEVEGNYEG